MRGRFRKSTPPCVGCGVNKATQNLLGKCEADLSQTNLRVSGIVTQCGSGCGGGALVNTLKGKSLRRSQALADNESLLYHLCLSLCSD